MCFYTTDHCCRRALKICGNMIWWDNISAKLRWVLSLREAELFFILSKNSMGVTAKNIFLMENKENKYSLPTSS